MVQETDKDSPYFGEWSSVPIDMCKPSRHCGCGNREAGMENCDHFFYDTDDKQRAKDELQHRLKNGEVAKIVEVKK